jgi:hypothetical protein
MYLRRRVVALRSGCEMELALALRVVTVGKREGVGGLVLDGTIQ